MTDATGDFVFPGTMPTPTRCTVTLEGFKTLKISGVAVSAGDRLALPAFDDRGRRADRDGHGDGETPLIQAASGERSFTIPTESVENLPISSRNFRTSPC